METTSTPFSPSRELMTAKTLDSDLEMACKLQMQEAMTTSLAVKPSSASASSPHNLLPPSPPHDGSNDAVLELAATLMLEDVERFAQEHEDHDRTVNETAELEAIVEGLDNALALDLKAVTFFCDDYMIYQYVMTTCFTNMSQTDCILETARLPR
ncbi:uncharacterized protein [Pyrus communis]|uniref:uncharacterized protein n=1 Tax=Pyrus communis TaxID=23211 RepID=UPI0035C1F427